MIYLFLGDDCAAKEARIAAIKLKLFKNAQEALAFDFDNLDAAELKSDALKKVFLTLPAMAPCRLILLRNIQKLKTADSVLLMNFCQKPVDYCDLILESSENVLKGELKDLSLYGKAEIISNAKGPNVFDMTKLISAGRCAQALKMLDGFYRENTPALQIMGALFWYWAKEGRSRGPEPFKRGLKALEEADLNIKRSRLNPQYALEKLVVELSGLFSR